jgi:hypothetical protein
VILSAILRRALALVAEVDLTAPCRRDLVAVLEAHHGAWINVWQDAGLDAGLAREELIGRGVALYFLSATCNLCDDVMDGDATYVPAPDAPLAQIVAHNAFVHALARTTVSRPGIAHATRMLFDVARYQHTELNAPPWDEERYRELARCSGGRQVAAYLRILWDGTPFEAEAEATGEALGAAIFVRADVADRDARLLAMPAATVRGLLEWAAAAAARAEAGTGCAAIRRVASQCARSLDEALAAGPEGPDRAPA